MIQWKNKQYKVHEGKRGGKYIISNRKKIYLKKGGETDDITHYISVIENVDDHYEVLISNPRNDIRPGTLNFYNERSKSSNLFNIYFPSFEYDNIDDSIQQKLSQMITNISYNSSNPQPLFVDTMNVPSDATVIVIGDVHGEQESLKNVFTHWYTSGFITNDGKLRQDIYVVSTGDLVDYHKYSVNVLYAMVKLRELNKDKVMLLTGNHEGSTDITGKDEFKTELQEYIRDNKLKVELNEFHRLLTTIGPAMLRLKYENDNAYFYMMHGMYPVTLKNKYPQNISIDFDIDNNPHNEISIEKFNIWSSTNTDQTQQNMIMPPNNNDCYPNFWTAVQWNDLSSNQFTKSGNRGFNYTVSLGTRLLAYIMEKEKIKAFIRGHQDQCQTQMGLMEGTDGYDCRNSVAVKGTRDDNWGNSLENSNYIKRVFSCNEKRNVNKIDGWCHAENVSPITGLPTSHDDIKKRLFTSSMAHIKSGTQARMGAYIIISPNPTGQQGGNSEPIKPIRGIKLSCNL